MKSKHISNAWSTSDLILDVPVRSTRQVGHAAEQGFRFVDLFAGIGGMRLGLERAGGRGVYSVELDRHAQITYAANFGPVDHGDIRSLDPADLPTHDVLAAGFPCQPFSLAGVSKKRSLGRPDGFNDVTSGNLFFEIRRILRVARPPIVLLENVRNLLAHDGGWTYRIIAYELHRLGYVPEPAVIDSSPWVPQRRLRTFIVALHRSTFGADARFRFPDRPTDGEPRLGSILEPVVDDKYTLSPALWSYLRRYAIKHRAAGNGFGYGLVTPDSVTRTLSARYYKDGSEILLEQGNDRPPRRLTPTECARLMGFPAPVRTTRFDDVAREEPPLRSFRIPVSDRQAYRQFGNSVVPQVVQFVAEAMVEQIFATLPASPADSNGRW